MAFSVAEEEECSRLLDWGLREDLGDAGDITSNALLDATVTGRMLLRSRKAGVVAGLPILALLAARRGNAFQCELLAQDGLVDADAPVARFHGPLREILPIERLALNLLSRLSGVATLTARYVQAIAGTKAVICDTRKTTPGWRHLEKYAVRVGGGTNHRTGLYDAILIKDNHLAGLASRQERPIAWAVMQARESVPAGTVVEVEVDSLTQLEEALDVRPDIVLLDNMPPENVSIAVEIRDLRAPGVLLEASGGINLATVAAVARCGIDRISVGALTHSAPALDLALDDETAGT
jgi:nicotinate-nucleotide pyrophosphorylase (carboxylating)